MYNTVYINLLLVLSNAHCNWSKHELLLSCRQCMCSGTSKGYVDATCMQRFTLALFLNLEKWLQAATLSPAVFRANILASIFDTLKNQKHTFKQEGASRVCSWRGTSNPPAAQTVEPVLLQWPPGPPGRPVLCPWCHCWCCERSAPSLPESPLIHTQPQQSDKPVQRPVRRGGAFTVELKWEVLFTFSSILVNFWSSLRVSEPLVIGVALMDSDGVQLSPPASPMSSSVAFKTFKTSVVMLQRDAAEYFCFIVRTQSHNS